MWLAPQSIDDADCTIGMRVVMHGTKLNMPVVNYSQLLSAAYGGTIKEAGLNGHIIQPKKLQDIAVKVVGKK